MTKFFVAAVPTKLVLQAIGAVTVRHAQLDRQLQMVIKTLMKVSVAEAVDATARDSSSTLRDRIRGLAKQTFGDGQTLVRIQALMQRAKRLTTERNECVHRVCARDIDGTKAQMIAEDHTMKPYPTVKELTALAADLHALTNELNHARLEGFIAEAMREKKRAAA
jgi:hypothetical protein